jgi:hypothetical protein
MVRSMATNGEDQGADVEDDELSGEGGDWKHA